MDPGKVESPSTLLDVAVGEKRVREGVKNEEEPDLQGEERTRVTRFVPVA